MKPVKKNPAQDGRRCLAEGALWVRDLKAAEACALRVLAGAVWVTLEGEAEDRVLGLGENRTFAGPGRLVMEPLDGAAEVMVENHFI